MNRVELMTVLSTNSKAIGLDEGERVPGLRRYVHTDDLVEAGMTVAHSRAAGTAVRSKSLMCSVVSSY